MKVKMFLANNRRILTPSAAARARILSHRGEPLLLADWERVLMIHFEVDADALQRDVPFEVDLRDGRAFVSLVAFTMRGMRPRFGGKIAALLFRPIATHNFLNVRTYVRHGGETGIHFLAEWLSNRLAVKLGPRTFGLPYRHGVINYRHDWKSGRVGGCVADTTTHKQFSYQADLKMSGPPCFAPCESGSLEEWLMERYTAFNCVLRQRKYFHIWHPPWPQCPVQVLLSDRSLLTANWSWFGQARLIGANFSSGLSEVWMGGPRVIGG
jgi:uncharacterized protein YqjF (DUF2071 family)